MNTKDLKQKIDQIDSELHQIVIDILKKNKESYLISKFNTNELFDHKNFSVFPNKPPKFNHHLNKLNSYIGDCLYWFETSNKADAERLNKLLSDYRLTKGTTDYRAVPTSNKIQCKDCVIYVGVRKGKNKNQGLTNIMGRINQHLGYYNNKNTQGLQLYHWARNENIDISLYVVDFKENLGSYLYVFEKIMAKELKPYCGRH